MASLWNGGLSDGNTNKRALENGYHCSSSGNTKNYKPRKISAVRDFPRGCGRNAQPINSEPQRNAVVPAGDHLAIAVETNCIGTEIEVGSQSSDIMKSPVSVEANGYGTSINLKLQENVVVPRCDPVAAGIGANAIETKSEIEAQFSEVIKSPVGIETNELGMPRNLEHQENMVVPHCDTVAGVTEDDAVKTETVVEPQSHEVLKGPIGKKTNEFGMPVNLEHQEIVLVPLGHDVSVVEKAHGVKTATKVETQSDGVVGSPIGIVQDESLDDLVGKAVAMVSDEMDNDVKDVVLDVKPMDLVPKDLEKNCAELLKEVNEKEDCALVELESGESLALVKSSEEDVKPLGANDVVVVGKICHKDEVLSSLKNKFCRRRVSATRDFPPYCGRNAPPLIEAVRLRITSGSESLVGSDFEKVFVKNEVSETSEDGVDTGELGKILPDMVEKGALQNLSTDDMEHGALGEAVASHGEGIRENVEDDDFELRKWMSLPNKTSDAVIRKDCEEGGKSLQKEIVSCGPVKTVKRRPSDNAFASGLEEEPGIVNALMAAPHCTWMQGELALSSNVGKTGVKVKKGKATWRQKSKAFAKKSVIKRDSPERSSVKKDRVSVGKDADGTPGPIIVRDEGKYGAQFGGLPEDFCSGNTHEFGVSVPPLGPSSSHGDARFRVRETLRLFQAICRKVLQGEEAKSRPEEEAKSKKSEKIKRIDLEAAKVIKERGKEVNVGKQYLGAVPGVEVGDEFQYRVELAIVGVHRLYQAGIDYIKHNGMLVAASIVASGQYADDMDNADVLIYSGQGGNIVGKDKQPEDQKLERGNLALRNGISAKNPVRVIRGSKEMKASDSSDSRAKNVMTYVYDGLYTVENYWTETGKYGKLVFMFELKRIPGQPELAWKEVKKSKKSKVRQGVCVDDIAEGKELLPVCAVNTIDNEKPPPFNYIREMMYPDWLHLLPPQGCDCIGRCTDSRKCSCALKNGEIPYNRNGAIVEAKHLVYECGPSCKCPPSCYNRVSQHGIKIQLEIFKTETRGWGVRSLTSIPSGSFICEYAGELLEDKEAEQRTGNDEYLFDIGQNYSDSFLTDGHVNLSEPVEEGGYAIDAAKYGNVGRFINHSCSPNLYAQNVLYDRDDKRMPHIMLFAAENIPPLQELTYHYNYTVDQVHDSNGNIKRKSCYCGSTECTGRMY